MQHKNILRAGTSSAFWVGLFLFTSAQASPLQQDTPTVAHASPAELTSSSGSLSPLSSQTASSQATQHAKPPQITPWHQVTVHSGDTLSGLFSRIGLGASQWAAVMKLGGDANALLHLQPGDTLDIRKTPTGELAQLVYPINNVKTLQVTRIGEQLKARISKPQTTTREVSIAGTVGLSLSRSMSTNGIPSKIASRVADVFGHRINLKHLRSGDKFAVVYRVSDSGGRRISTGPMLAARITTHHHVYRAFRAEDSNGDYGYFDASGESYKPAFLRTPVAYTRISSRFNLHRLNPVTHRVMPHEGVDLAAPIGTPIHAAAEGTVKYAGWMHGYGRIVELKNFDGYSTRYAHMHKIAPGIKVGSHVTEGQIIGYVGETGRATGPHLHFEIRRHGVAYNPLTVKLPAGHKLPATRLARFEHRIRPLIARLSPQPTALLVNSDTPTGHKQSCPAVASANTTIGLNPALAVDEHGEGNIFCIVNPSTS